MTGILGEFTQQPAERLDYDIDFARWLAVGDTIVNATASIDVGSAALDGVDFGDTSVKVWVTGGADRDSGKVEVTVTSAAGRVVVAPFRLRIREW